MTSCVGIPSSMAGTWKAAITMRLGWRWHLAELKAHYWELLDVGIYTFWGRGLEIGGMLCLFNFEMAMRFLNKLRASKGQQWTEALRLLANGEGSSLAFMRTGWCGYHHLYIFCYIKLWLLIVLYIRYILILFLLYINIDINIYVYIYIYIYVYAVYDFCYHTIQISTLWSAYIYIYRY